MAWFKRDRDGSVPKELRAALRTEAASVPVGQQHAAAIVDYVVSGDNPKVLTAIASGRGHTFFGHHGDPAARKALFTHLGSVDPEVWVRWGQVLEAGVGTSQWTTPMANAGAIPAWLEHLIGSLGTAYAQRHYGVMRIPPDPVPLDFSDVAAVVQAGGEDVLRLLDAMFVASSNMEYSGSFAGRRALAGTSGFPEALVANLDRVQGRLTSGGVEQRLLFCHLVSGFGDAPLAALAPHLAVAATSTSTRVRDAAQPLLLRVLPAGTPALEELATKGKPDVRALALELLWYHGGEAGRDFAARTAAADRTSRIRALADTWTGNPAAASDDLPPELVVPAPAPVTWRVEVDAELRRHVERAADWHNQQVRQSNEQMKREKARYKARFGQQHPVQWKDLPLEPGLAKRLLDVLDSDVPPRNVQLADHHHFANTAGFLASLPGVSAVAVIKVLAEVGHLVEHQGRLGHHAVQVLEACHRRDREPDLLTLQVVLDEIGLSGCEVIWKSVTASWQTFARGWPDDDVWPFLARNIDFVVAHARPAEGDWATDASAFYRLVGTLPVQPPVLVETLYGIALGIGKTHRAEAQHALRTHPDRARRAAAALTDGKSEVRTVAATWLGQIADPGSLPALETAVAKEKQDVAKGAMLDALEALGRPVEVYLDRDRLTADAEKSVAKGLPKDLDWLAWDRLPEQHWADSGERAQAPVVQHLVAQAVRAKSAEPNAILRKYCGMLAEQDRQVFARALLESWLAADTQPIPLAEAQQRAHAQASQTFQYMQSYPRGAYSGTPVDGMSLAELTAYYLPALARQPAGSAAASKGVLAVVAACGGRDVVPPTERYLKEWYGQRSSQGKALIGMLAWIDHPTATQLLLSIGSRFRTKSFQTEATRQVEALAEREGWTVAQLADRTVPTAGFDADGRLELSYGERSFTAVLLPDLGVELRNDEGTVVKALPSPRQSDDAEMVKAAKASFTAAKKELKSLAALQKERLYEALCTERTWAVEDWQRFLAGHPVMRLLCQRLVWVAEPSDRPSHGPKVVFRLLDDGTLSDVADDEVTLPAAGVVRLAHDTNLEPDQVEAWLQHLADYEVQPLFQQLGKSLHALPEELRSRESIDDFRGHTLEAFTLRNRALKLGWVHGAAEDGGWFHLYAKRFPTLGLVAELAFTGNGLPEENRTVGLLGLSFVREDPEQQYGGRQVLPLGAVPEVLLSETWHDVRSIAAEGGGFDPNWERNTEF